MTPTLQYLLDEAKHAKARIAAFDSRISALRAQLATNESTLIQYADVDTTDQKAMLELAAKKLTLEILPKQMAELDSSKGAVVRELGEAADKLKRALREAASYEQARIITEIAKSLEPYSTIQVINNGEKYDPAVNAARSMPIINSIGALVTFANQPPDDGNGSRERDSGPFDSDMASYADEIIGVADRFIANNNSFVFAPFKTKA